MSQLDQVLQRIDSDLDSSLERLFEWLTIPSISTDPAYKDHCRKAGEWLVDELKGIGIEASLRETGGHPVVLGHAKGDEQAARAVLRPLRRAAGRSARPVGDAALRAAHRDAARRPQGHQRARRLRRQGPGDDLRRGLPGLEGRDGLAADRHHLPGRGRGGGRLEVPAGIRRGQQGRAEGRRGPRLRHRHVGPGHARASPRPCAAWSTRK